MKTSIPAMVLAICLSGCAAIPVTQQTPRNYNGFSIVPPQEQGWFVNTPGNREVVFQKKSSSDTHRMLVGVERSLAPKTFSSKEEFLQYVNDSFFIADPHFTEFLAKETSLNSKHGEYCVEYRYKYKDYKSPRPKSASFMLQEGHCFVCLHPNAKNLEYDVCYSEIFAPGEEDGQFRIAGDAFIDSIEFTEPSSAKSGARDLMSISAELGDNRNRVYILHQFPTFYRLNIEIDGEKVDELSSWEVTSMKFKPGQHTIKVYLSGIGGLDRDRPEISFATVQDKSNYFVIRLIIPPGIRLRFGKKLEILEVTEDDWKIRAADPLRGWPPKN